MESRKSLTIKELFFVSMIVGIIFYIVMAPLSNGSSVVLSLFRDPNDVFMDFFNSIYDSTKSYEESGVIYPPFINLCYRILSCAVVPFATNAFDSRTTVAGAMIFIITLIIIVSSIHCAINTLYVGKRKELLTIIILLSMPFLFCLERGNIIIVAALLVIPFIRWYDSENKRKRYFAYLCLALSINIKLYPVAFSLLVLRNKQYKEFLLLALMTLAIFFVSLLLLNDSCIDYIRNLFATSDSSGGGIGISNFVYVVSDSFGISQYSKVISYSVMGIVILLSSYLVIKSENIEKWKLVTLLSLILCTCGTFNSYYCLVYMFLPLVMFLNTNPERKRENMLYVSFFILMMIPLVGFHSNIFDFDINISPMINSVIPIIALFYLLIVEIMRMNKWYPHISDMGSVV